MSRAVGTINLASSNPWAYVNPAVSTAAFLSDRFVVNVANAFRGHLFLDATVSGTGAYFRAEIWHSHNPGVNDWYLLSTAALTVSGSSNKRQDIYLENFGPCLRLKYAFSSAGSQEGIHGTVRAIFSYREE